MPILSSRPDAELVDPDAAESLRRAEAHLNLLRAYFGFQAWVGVLGGILLLLAPLLHATVTIHGRPWLAVPLFAATTWAAFRTRRLLGERDPQGLAMAVVTFASALVAAASAHEVGSAAVFATLGMLLTINVYRHRHELRF